MSLQLCPAPLFLSNTPFCSPSTCTHLDRICPSMLTEHLSATTTSNMDTTGVVPLRFELDGAVLGAANNNPSASPSPGVMSASIVTTASPYPIASSSASSMQLMSSDASLGREPKRPRIIRRQSSAMSGTQTNNLSDRSEHQSIDGAHERLDINYSQDLGRSSQSRYANLV